MLYITFKLYLKRLLRDPFSLGMFTVLPLVIIYIISMVNSNSLEAADYYVNGYNMVATYVSIGMMLVFQLNSGLFLMNFMESDFKKEMKWRLRATPCPMSTVMFGCGLASTLFTTMQGMLVVVVSRIFMDAYWGNYIIVTLVVFLISVFSQGLGIVLYLICKRLSAAEMASWGISWFMAAIGGFMFTLPDNAFLNFMQTYGSPFSLARMAIFNGGFIENNMSHAIVLVLMMFGVNVLLGGVVVVLSRRSIA